MRRDEPLSSPTASPISGMPGSARGVRPSPWRRPLHRFAYEAVLGWRFNRADLPAAVIPGVLFSVSAWWSLHLSWTGLPRVLGGSLLYFWLFLSVHTLSNQLVGIEEDRVNKPTRPLPRGLVSARGAAHRLIVALVCFLVLGQLLDVLAWTVLWVVLVGIRLYDNLVRWWFVKNPAIVGGALALLGAASRIAGQPTASGWWWVVAGTAYWLVGFVEDLRDVPGDLAVGRRTLPMVMGPKAVRLVVGTAVLLMPAAATLLLGAGRVSAWPGSVWFGGFAVGCLVVTGRLWALRTYRHDALTYQLYCFLWCWLLCGPLFLS